MPTLSPVPTSKIDIDFIRAQGDGSTGVIIFTPPRMKIGSHMLTAEPVRVEVNAGRAVVDLVRLPFGVYKVQEIFDGRMFDFLFSLPTDSPDEIQYENISPSATVPSTYVFARSVNGVTPDPSTGNITVPAEQGLKAYGTTGLITGVFGPCGDSGPWTLCPTQYMVESNASSGDHLLWTPAFFHQNDQEAAYDIVSVVGDEPARWLSTGTASPSAAGHSGLYTVAGRNGGMKPMWWTVSSDDLVFGVVTLAIAYRDNGSGNSMGHDSLPGSIILTNHGQPPV